MIQFGKNLRNNAPEVDTNRRIFEQIRDKLPEGEYRQYSEWLLSDHQNNLCGRIFWLTGVDDMFATFDEGQTFCQVVQSYDGLNSGVSITPQITHAPESSMYKLWLTETSPTTCPLCMDHQGLIVDTFMENLGVEPPLHPHCNCKLVPMKCILLNDWVIQPFDRVFANTYPSVTTESPFGQNPSSISSNGLDFIRREEGFESKPYVGADTDNITIGIGFAVIDGVKIYNSYLTHKEKDAIAALAKKLQENPNARFSNVVLDNVGLMQQLRNDFNNEYSVMGKSGLWMSEYEAMGVLKSKLETEFVPSINVFLERNPQVKLTQYQFDALVDLAYNFGPGYFTNTGKAKGDTIRDFLIESNYSESESLRAFETYSNPNGRRTREALLFSTGRYS